jgi:hypothetical protein
VERAFLDFRIAMLKRTPARAEAALELIAGLLARDRGLNALYSPRLESAYRLLHEQYAARSRQQRGSATRLSG